MKMLLPFLILLVLFAWGCGKSEKNEETKKPTIPVEETTTGKKIVARVDERPIYEEDLKGRPLQDVIDYEVLYEAGLKQGLDKKVEPSVEDYKKRIIVATQMNEFLKNFKKGEEITDKEIEDYYKENKDKFTLLHITEIASEDKNLAEEIHKRALNGEDFHKIASDYSKSEKHITVRDLGWNKRFNDLFRGKGPGSVSEVMQEGNEFRILKLLEVKDMPLPKMKEAIKYAILAKRRSKAMHEFAEKQKEENNIKVEILDEKK